MLRYVRPPVRLSMSRHWEFAFSQCRGKYVCFVGDDDGLMFGALSAAFHLLERNDSPPALNSVNAEYHWPNSPIPYHQSLIRVPIGPPLVQRRSAKVMLDLLRRNLRVYSELPMLYRGFVRRDVLNDIRSKTKELFRSSIPDVYTAVAVGAVIPEYLFTNVPLFVEGLSGASNGASCNWNTCDSDKQFFVEDSIPFHADLEFCGVNSFLHAESLLQCRDAGLLEECDMMDPSDLISSAAIGARGLITERYDQVWRSIIQSAEKFGLVPFAEELRAEYPKFPLDIDPFPASTLWPDIRGSYEPSLAIRSDRFGCRTVLDCVELLKGWVDVGNENGTFSERLVVELAAAHVRLGRSSAPRGVFEGVKYSRRQLKRENQALRQTVSRLSAERARPGLFKRLLKRLRRFIHWFRWVIHK
jgi:hypothetical protein